MSEFGNSKLDQIIREARTTERDLREVGLTRHANVVARLINSRIASNAENKRCNREYRELLARPAPQQENEP